MNFTFSFFYPIIVTAFTSLWAACGGVHHHSPSIRGVQSVNTPGHVASVSRSRRKPASALRRSARLRHKYAVPGKPIASTHKPRRLRREGAIADLQQLETRNSHPVSSLSHRPLKREDSFILVDFGDHFRMVKPAYAKRNYHLLPEDITTVAPFHALGSDINQEELREWLQAVPITMPGAKRVRFKEEMEVDDVRPRKRRRTV